eukprot:m.26054 g.26054  ORF g.26054 m.26054 type:complete len:230 (+) comp29106_c1_seq1:2173-2862(+)
MTEDTPQWGRKLARLLWIKMIHNILLFRKSQKKPRLKSLCLLNIKLTMENSRIFQTFMLKWTKAKRLNIKSKKTKAKAKAKDKDKDKDPSAIYAKVDKSKKKKKKEKEAREDPVGEKKQSDEEPEKPKDVISLFLGDSEKEKLAQEQPGKTKTARHFLVKKPEWRKGREMSRSQSEEVRSPKGLVKARKAMFEGMSSKASTLPKTTTEENQDERTGKPEKATEETWLVS